MLVLPEPNRNQDAVQQTGAIASEVVPRTLLLTTYGITLLTQIVFYMIPVQIPFYQKVGFKTPSL